MAETNADVSTLRVGDLIYLSFNNQRVVADLHRIRAKSEDDDDDLLPALFRVRPRLSYEARVRASGGSDIGDVTRALMVEEAAANDDLLEFAQGNEVRTNDKNITFRSLSFVVVLHFARSVNVCLSRWCTVTPFNCSISRHRSGWPRAPTSPPS